jgi:hypothetical protein
LASRTAALREDGEAAFAERPAVLAGAVGAKLVPLAVAGAAAGAVWAALTATATAKRTAEQPTRQTREGDAKIWDEREGFAESVRITLATFLSPAENSGTAASRMQTAVGQ